MRKTLYILRKSQEEVYHISHSLWKTISGKKSGSFPQLPQRYYLSFLFFFNPQTPNSWGLKKVFNKKTFKRG